MSGEMLAVHVAITFVLSFVPFIFAWFMLWFLNVLVFKD